MRPNLFALLASAAVVSATGCVQDNIAELAERSNCGKSKTIAECLQAAVDLARLEDVEWCYVAGGCHTADATAEAMWFTQDCRAFEVQEAEGELRRRADSSSTAASSTQASTTSTASVASTSATTTDSTTASSSTTLATSSVSSTTSSSSSTSSDSSTSSGSTSTGLVCSSTSTITTTACGTTSGSTTCTTTLQATSSCASGMLCFAATTTSAASCLKIDNHLTTSGLVITILFAVGILFTIICFVVSGLRASSNAKKEASAKLLASADMGKGKDVEATNPFSSEASLPLMTDDVMGGQEYSAAGQGAPKLNQGIGGLGQQTSEARY